MKKIVITCEHATNIIPPQFADAFQGYRARLESHEGWDIGAKELALAFGENTDYLFLASVSRLLIELNRSLRNPHLFSDISKNLPLNIKKQLIAQYFIPYREEVTKTIAELIHEGHRIVHLSVHTFSPVLNGIERAADVGFLYDPKRDSEKKLASEWRKKIYSESRDFQVRFNFPYQGKSDGFVTALRKKFPNENYVGLELEVNQKHVVIESNYCQLKTILPASFCSVINSL